MSPRDRANETRTEMDTHPSSHPEREASECPKCQLSVERERERERERKRERERYHHIIFCTVYVDLAVTILPSYISDVCVHEAPVILSKIECQYTPGHLTAR